jgi:hypothetical protein
MGICTSVPPSRLVIVFLATVANFAGHNAIAGDGAAQSKSSDGQIDPSFEIVTGINWLNLPGWNAAPTDIFGGTENSRWTDDGLALGFKLDLPIGEIGAQPLILEWNGSVADLSSSSSSRTSLAGQTTYDMQFGNTANGSINTLVTTAPGTLPTGGTADVTVNDSAGGTANILSTASSPAGGRVTQFASKSAVTGGAFAAVVTNGDSQSSAAFAAYGDNTGFTLAAIGDLSTSAILSTRSEDTTVVDQTLLLGAPIDLSDGWSVTPKFGPTYRLINRDVDFTRTIDIGESVAGVAIPAVGIAQSDELDARYIGAIGGLTVTKWLQPDLSLSLDAKLGAAYLRSSYRSQVSAIIPNVAIAASDQLQDTRHDTSMLAGLNAGVRYAAKENVIVSFNAGVDFTSKVPTIEYVSGAGGVTPTIAMSHALSYNASVSITWRF